MPNFAKMPAENISENLILLQRMRRSGKKTGADEAGEESAADMSFTTPSDDSYGGRLGQSG